MATLLKNTAKYSLMVAAATVLVSAAPALAAKKGASNAERRGVIQSIETALLNRTTDQAQADSVPDATDTPADTSTTASTSTDPTPAPDPAPVVTPDPTPVPVAAPDPAPAAADPSTPVIVNTPTAPAPIDTATETNDSTSSSPTPAPVAPAPTQEPVATQPVTITTPLTPTTNTKKQNTKKINAIATSTGAIATSGIGSLIQDGTNAGEVYGSTRFTAGETQNLLALAAALFVLGFILTGDKWFKRSLAGITNSFKVGAQPEARRSRA